MRPATARDLALRQHWEAQQPEALHICQQTAQTVRGYEEIQFVAALYNYDGTVLTILFNAPERVDMAKLEKALRLSYEAQVELHQIGPRETARLLGGLGACGIERCCSTFLTDFSPVSLRMAKAQGLTLNASEITGMCGRLRCCLVYEYEQYVEARRVLPRVGKVIGTPFGESRVIDVNPLMDAVTIATEDGVRHVVQREDIVPLEELRALEAKAKAPCDKHGDEPCDCGKPPGQRRADATGSDTADAADHS
jgi:cell fate regulator YaaT (PSP1 superfamily)